jgi:hypothetical protein
MIGRECRISGCKYSQGTPAAAAALRMLPMRVPAPSRSRVPTDTPSQFRRLAGLTMPPSGREILRGNGMKGWMSQIVIGVIVTVVGTVIADAILQGGKGRKRFFGESHFSGLPRAGR